MQLGLPFYLKPFFGHLFTEPFTTKLIALLLYDVVLQCLGDPTKTSENYILWLLDLVLTRSDTDDISSIATTDSLGLRDHCNPSYQHHMATFNLHSTRDGNTERASRQ